MEKQFWHAVNEIINKSVIGKYNVIQIKMVADQQVFKQNSIEKMSIIFNRKDVVMSAGPQVITDCSTFRKEAMQNMTTIPPDFVK